MEFFLIKSTSEISLGAVPVAVFIICSIHCCFSGKMINRALLCLTCASRLLTTERLPVLHFITSFRASYYDYKA